MKTINLLFPGQGSQYVGMAKELLHKESNQPLITQINERLGFNLAALMLEGPEEKLKLTQFTQPAIVLHSYLIFIELKKALEKNNIEIGNVLGHSVGEYSALVACGSLTIHDALSAVHQRGIFMQKAVPEGKGKMLAVLKVPKEKVEKGCKECSLEDQKVMPANYNSPSQIVVSGDSAACDRLSDWLSDNISEPYKIIELKVSAPFHSSLMKPAARNLEKFIKNMKLESNILPYIANVDARKYEHSTSPEIIKSNLINQVAGSVLWTQSFMKLSEDQHCFEVGPGKTLMGLGRSINRNIKVSPTDGVDINKLI